MIEIYLFSLIDDIRLTTDHIKQKKWKIVIKSIHCNLTSVFELLIAFCFGFLSKIDKKKNIRFDIKLWLWFQEFWRHHSDRLHENLLKHNWNLQRPQIGKTVCIVYLYLKKNASNARPQSAQSFISFGCLQPSALPFVLRCDAIIIGIINYYSFVNVSSLRTEQHKSIAEFATIFQWYLKQFVYNMCIVYIRLAST